MGGLWKELQRTENWETTSDHLLSFTESHKEWRACELSPSCPGVKIEGQRTWGATETEHGVSGEKQL